MHWIWERRTQELIINTQVSVDFRGTEKASTFWICPFSFFTNPTNERGIRKKLTARPEGRRTSDRKETRETKRKRRERKFSITKVWNRIMINASGVCGIKEGKWLTASVLCEDFAAYLKTHAYTHMNRRDIIFFSEDNFLITRCRSTNDSNLQGELRYACVFRRPFPLKTRPIYI